MDNDRLFTVGPPNFYVTTIGLSEFANLYLQLTSSHKEAVIRMIRGKKSKTLDAFYNEVGAALQFPYYFGENWPAFDECINDLDWVPGDAYLLLISRADLLLCEEPVEFPVLMRLLANACVEWLTPNKYGERGLAPTAFHIVFQCEASDLPTFSQRLTLVGISPASL